MEAITCELPLNKNSTSKTSWTNDSSIKLESNESRGYVVNIILNSEPIQQQQQQEVHSNTDGGATATVLHVSSSSSSSSCISSSSCSGPSAVKERDIDVGRLSGSSIKISLSGNSVEEESTSNIININNINNKLTTTNMVRPDQFFYFPEAPIISGLSSPSTSDNNDSGAGSDFDGATPPPLPKRKQQLSSPVDSGVSSVTTHSSSNGSITDEEEEDSISCDSLNSSELNNDSLLNSPSPPQIIDTILPKFNLDEQQERLKSLSIVEDITVLQQPALQVVERPPPPVIVKECTYADRTIPQAKQHEAQNHYYDFHLNENFDDSMRKSGIDEDVDTSFAGVHDILSDRKAIRSAKGTVRGVKNRVRAGIATFLQLEDTRNFKEREQGKLVVYTTTMGVVRSTYLRCVKVKQILRTLLVKFEERDVFMSRDTQEEIRTRMKTGTVVVPQVFLEGHHLGDAETIERLNESGELRRLLRPFKCPGASTPCATCGGYRLLPCNSCNGSKKSVHRNHFTAEFVALKCMTCDESGLMRCYTCS